MFAILLGALLVADTPEPAPAAPKGPAPRILTASVKGDQLLSQVNVAVVVPVQVTKKVIVNGQATDVVETVYTTQTQTRIESWDLKKATVTTAGGKKVDLDDLKKQLAKPQPIVLSSDGKAVEAGYLKLFDKDALVIVLPVTTMPAPKK